MKKRNQALKKIVFAGVGLFMTASVSLFMNPCEAKAASIPVYHGIPAYQQKDIFAEETVKIQGITVEKEVSGSKTSPIQEPVQFVIYNSTKQVFEQRVQSVNGVLPDLNLIKDHNYMIIAEDTKYKMKNVCVWVKNNRIVNIKKNVDTNNYPEVKSLILTERATEEPNPKEDNKFTLNLPVTYGEGPMANVKFKLVSAVDTVEAVTTNKGQLRASILEDITYMVVVDSDKYTIEPLALAAKDKTEYGGGRYAFNHADCNRIYGIQLIDKVDETTAHKNDTTAVSLSGKVSVTGMNFRDFLILEKELDKSLVTGLESDNYSVLDIKVVNPHRWEISRLAEGEFPITVKMDKNKTVANVYYLDGDKNLQPLDFEQTDDNRIRFTMNSMSIYPVVIEYESESEEVKPMNGTWMFNSKGWWYRYANGSWPRNCWDKIDNEWYYFNASGYRVTGWSKIKGVWYLFDTDGMLFTDKWVSNGTYYLKSTGAMATGWEKIDGKWYYFGSNGVKTTGWIKVGGTWYFMDSQGVMAASEWINDTYYLKSNGAMATGWQQIGGNWYYFGGNGVKATGWTKAGGTWYYMDSQGIMAASEWIEDTYYLKSNGAMATGWQQIDESWYYFDRSGAKLTSRWYGKYYFKEDGIMAVSEWVDNDRYFVDENGAWVPGATKS